MDTHEIDALLAQYTAAETRIGANLLELDDHPAYDLLTSGSFVGTTAAELGPAAKNASHLYDWLHEMGRVLDEARAIRGSGRVGSSERDELRALLRGPSVVIARVSRQVTERELTSAADETRRLSIAQTIELMRSTYDPIRAAVAKVDEIWRAVMPSVDAAGATAEALRSELSQLGTDSAALQAAEIYIEHVRSIGFEDPLGLGTEAAGELDGLVADASRDVAGLRRGHDELADDLVSTTETLARLRSVRAHAAAAFSESGAKITNVEGLRHPPSLSVIDGERGLAARLEALRASPAPWRTRRNDLDRWLTTAERLERQLTAALEANRRPLALRNELRGRFDAYRSKAEAVGAIDEPHLRRIADLIDSELFTSPTDLAVAADLIDQYRAGMSSDGARGGGR